MLAAALSLCFCGCGDGTGGIASEEQTGNMSPAEPAVQQEESVPASSYSGERTDFHPYQAPEFLDSVFHADHAQGEEGVQIDLEHTDEGYIGIAVQSEARIKLQVIMGEEEYRYNIPSDGTPAIIPLTVGDGTYTFTVRKHVGDTRYALLYSVDHDVALRDEFQPFLRPSAYVDYAADSKCIEKASELAAGEEDVLGVVGAVFDYISENIVYDKEKAASVQDGTLTNYLPVLDDTLASGKGICFDYASLAAAMLRSQGIPAKMVFGHVSPDGVYHAWNMFYTEETGWVTVDYEVKEGSWNRLDLTFSANGADSEFIGDGSNYADELYY